MYDDEDMTKECLVELERIEISQKKLEKDSNGDLSTDENDYQIDDIVEIRAGAGVNEARHFASKNLRKN